MVDEDVVDEDVVDEDVVDEDVVDEDVVDEDVVDRAPCFPHSPCCRPVDPSSVTGLVQGRKMLHVQEAA